MTTNQTRAVMLARAVTDGRLSADMLCDEDWMLLLLAAGLRQAPVSPEAVARRVLDTARTHAGYFWPGDRARRSSAGLKRTRRHATGTGAAGAFPGAAAAETWGPPLPAAAAPSFAA